MPPRALPSSSPPPASPRPASRLTALVALLGVALVAGCGTDEGTTPPGGVAAYELVEVATIGGELDEGPGAFSRVSGVAFADGGRVLVLDWASNELRMFDTTGRFLSRAGREGAGPGELSGPAGLAVAPDGTIWVRDGGNSRYVRFRIEGDSLRQAGEFRLQEGGGGYAAAPSFDGTARLIHVGLGGTPGSASPTLTRFTYEPTGGAPIARLPIAQPSPDSIGQHAVAEARGVTRYYYAPMSPAFLLAHAPGGAWARAVSSVPEVEWYDAAGALIRRVTVASARVTLSAAERARADTAMIRDRQSAGQELPFSVPDAKPPLRAIYFDAEGRLWVEHSVADGAPRRADRFDAAGAPAGQVEWPTGVSLVSGRVGSELVAGIARDELDVQRIVLLRLRPVSAPDRP